jgi:hypothetical protein
MRFSNSTYPMGLSYLDFMLEMKHSDYECLMPNILSVRIRTKQVTIVESSKSWYDLSL